MNGISHIAGGEHGPPNHLQVPGPRAARNLTEDLLVQSIAAQAKSVIKIMMHF